MKYLVYLEIQKCNADSFQIDKSLQFVASIQFDASLNSTLQLDSMRPQCSVPLKTYGTT